MEEDKVDLSYLKGFNDGYLMSQHMPKLAEQLSHIKSESTRLMGMRDGHKQYLSEQVKDKLPSWLTGERRVKDSPAPDKQKTRDVDPPTK